MGEQQRRRQLLSCALALPALLWASACDQDRGTSPPARPRDDLQVPPLPPPTRTAGVPPTAVRPRVTITAAPRSDPPTPSAASPPATTVAGPEVRFDSVVVRVELAQTAAERTRGLGGHAPLGADEGMLFVFPAAGRHSFWMKGMTFALDIIWIRDGQVVYVVADVPPPRPGTPDSELPIYTPPAAANYVLEVPAGFAARWGIQAGSRIVLHGVP